jgi:RNA polymerase sigma-70 factor (ECF subfamily)
VAGPETTGTAGPTVVDQAEAVLDRAVVTVALERLSGDHRDVIVQTYLNGWSYEKLADAHGVPAGTLRSRMFYALKALRLVMAELGMAPAGDGARSA